MVEARRKKKRKKDEVKSEMRRLGEKKKKRQERRTGGAGIYTFLLTENSYKESSSRPSRLRRIHSVMVSPI